MIQNSTETSRMSIAVPVLDFRRGVKLDIF